MKVTENIFNQIKLELKNKTPYKLWLTYKDLSLTTIKKINKVKKYTDYLIINRKINLKRRQTIFSKREQFLKNIWKNLN